jgi:hypothetical protein
MLRRPERIPPTPCIDLISAHIEIVRSCGAFVKHHLPDQTFPLLSVHFSDSDENTERVK